MRTNLVSAVAAACVLAGVVGCQSVDLSRKPWVVTREMLEDKDKVEFPGAYNTENFRNLNLVVVARQEGKDEKGPKITRGVLDKVEQRMVKLKRFSVKMRKGKGDDLLEARADNDPTLALAQEKTVVPDLLLDVSLRASKEKYPYEGNKYKLIYTVAGSVSMKDKSGTGVEGEDILGQAARQSLYRGVNRIGGFDEYDKAQVENVLESAAMRAFTVLFSKLGNKYPIGGTVTGVSPSGESISLDKGTEQGVNKQMQFTLFVRKGTIDIPIAYAEAEPSRDRSMLTIWRWNTDTADGKAVVKQFRADPEGFLAGNKGNVFAAGWGLAVPAEWDVDGSNPELQKLLEN